MMVITTYSPHRDAGPQSSADQQRLLGRIRSKVPVEISSVEIAGHQVPWLKVVNPDRLLENALERKDRSPEELDPFWAATWRAAIGLDRHLASYSLRDVRVLELGCGSGRAGIAAALRGAQVTLTDAASEGLLVATWNAWTVRERTSVRRLHWRDEILDEEKFPIIIGSDIVYDPSLWPILEPCMRRHVAGDGVVILTEPQRHTGDRFIPWITQAGWKLDSKLIDLGDQQREIRIFECRLP